MDFERQSEIMEMKEEMMNDAIDDAMGDEDDEDERWRIERCPFLVLAHDPNTKFYKLLIVFCFMYSDAIVSQVLDELGLNLSDELSSKKNIIVFLPNDWYTMYIVS